MDAYEREPWKQFDERRAEAEKPLKATASQGQAGISDGGGCTDEDQCLD